MKNNKQELNPQPRPLEQVYAHIAALRDPEALERDLADELAQAAQTFTQAMLRRGRLSQRAWRLCQDSILDMDDLTNELTAELVQKTAFITAKAPGERMTTAFHILKNNLISIWRRNTKHFGKEVKDPDRAPDSPRTFAGGYRLDSLDQLLEDACEPVLSSAAQLPAAEQGVLFSDKAREVFQVIRQKLSEKELAAFLMVKAQEDPVIAGWAADFGSVGAFDQKNNAQRNSLCRANRKMRELRPQICQILFS